MLGENTSRRHLKKMLKDRGIEILQSIPYAHQQNGRAERIIRTITEKAESMRLQACIPQSWWEFSIEHATHVNNRTPMCRHNWQTPYTLLYGEKPSLEHLRVFGCGAYIFLPAEVQANKLAPKSELMTYLGNAPGAGGFMFMRSPNNVLFYSTHCIFNEVLFPKCATPVKKSLTRLLDAPPVRATLPSALNAMNASSVGKLVQLVTASRLILYHEEQIDPMKDECHYQVKH